MKIRYWLIGWLLVAWIAAPAWAGQKSFAPGSLADIERANAGEAFVLVLWEVSCPPCHAEMAMLGRLRADHPEMNLVFVGTDPIGMEDEVAALLEKYGLAGVESWLFIGGNVERLRYSIDPDWYGELPRNYFYAADGSRSGFSGKLDEQRVLDWLLAD